MKTKNSTKIKKMQERNNAGPRTFEVPQERKPIKWSHFSAKNTITIQQQRCLESKTCKKWSLRNPNFCSSKKSQLQNKSNSSLKGHDSYFFGPNMVPKKVWVPPKKSISSKKKKLILFSSHTLSQKSLGPTKKYEFQKGRNSYTFFGPYIVPKNVRVSPKKVWVPKRKELILFRAKHCAEKSMGSRKSMSSKWHGAFLPVLFFCLSWKSVQTRISSNRNKKYRKKGNPKVWVPYFLDLIYIFLEPRLFLAQCMARKKVWVPSFLELIFFCGAQTFLAQCSARKSMSSFFSWTSYFFGLAPDIFWHNVWPEKSMSSFFWNPYFFWHNVWHDHVWVFVFQDVFGASIFWNKYQEFLEIRFFQVSDSEHLCCWIVLLFLRINGLIS